MKLMALDGNSIVNRAFYAIRTMTTQDGEPTNAIYGFLMILNKLMTEESPDALCVTFDLPAPTFRHTQYTEYKAQRKGMPEDLAVQMPVLKDVLTAMRIPYYELEGYEADDLLGTISAKCQAADWDCVIVTGDRDSLQLVGGRTVVKLISTRGGKTETKAYDTETLEAEYGFPPAQIVDLKALMGDASDNIPGVAGVGEKTAMDLLHRFGTVAAIYENLDTLDIREALRKKLQAGAESAKLSYALATIQRDVPLDFDPAQNRCQAPDRPALRAIFTRLEFRKFLEKYELNTPDLDQPAEAAAPALSWVSPSAAELPQVLDQCRQAERVYFLADQEFNALAVATEEQGWFLVRQQLEKAFDDFLPAFFSEKVQKATVEVKDLTRRLLEEGLPAEGFVFDVALGAYLLDPSAGNYSLSQVADRLLHRAVPEAELYNGPQAFGLLGPGAELVAGMEQGAEAVKLLYAHIQPLLTQYGMTWLFQQVEMPLCRVLADMEKQGFLVDRQALADFGEALQTGIDQLQASIYDLAGETFNINSPKQLGEVLFDKLMLPAPKRTKTGYSTNIDVLERLKNKHPIIQQIMDYRQLTKLKSTYTDGLLKEIQPDGRIHTKFQMTVTATGRLSSTEPNLQNIPIRRELGGEIRKMFVAAPGCVLVDADYSQIELRLLAHISGDETMQQAFRQGEDIHAVTASQVFGVPLEEVTALQRSRAKAVNFGIVYGISDFSLAQDIGVTRAEAKQYMDSYLEKYHGVREYMHNIVEKAKADGYVTTMFGRRRYLPELKSSNYNVRSFGERVALNMPIQGAAADIMKIAMVRAYAQLRKALPEARLLLQVHDELICEVPEAQGAEAQAILKAAMEGAAELAIPLTVDAHVGKNWYDAK